MPLTEKGQKIKSAMEEQYGKKKGTSVFYASKNKGRIKGVDAFRTTIRDALAEGVPIADALGRGVSAAMNTRDAVRSRRRSFFRNMRDAASHGLSAKDALADAVGRTTGGAGEAAVAAANKQASAEAEKIRTQDRRSSDYGVKGMKKGVTKQTQALAERHETHAANARQRGNYVLASQHQRAANLYKAGKPKTAAAHIQANFLPS